MPFANEMQKDHSNNGYQMDIYSTAYSSLEELK